uniref:VPS13_C domain-containing protein n=1 Tax=Macrostomum lignano TaxID=282301 RepID=A0A1I8JS81_9PLAT
ASLQAPLRPVRAPAGQRRPGLRFAPGTQPPQLCGCELAAPRTGRARAARPEARVCLLCKCSCLTYGVACIRHSVPVPSGLFLKRLQWRRRLSPPSFTLLVGAVTQNLIGGGSLAIEQQLAGEAKDANEKDNSLLISSKLDVDDDEVGGYFGRIAVQRGTCEPLFKLPQVPAPPPPQPPVSLSADSLEASVLSEQRRRRRIQLARSFSAGLHAASRTDLERRLADRLLDLPDNVWDRHSNRLLSDVKRRVWLSAPAAACSRIGWSPPISKVHWSPLDGSVVELRPRLSERCPVVRLHLGGSVADYVELRLSADSGSGASLTPSPRLPAFILRCLLGELPDLSLCGGVSGSGGRRRHSRRCQVLMLDRDAACCLALSPASSAAAAGPDDGRFDNGYEGCCRAKLFVGAVPRAASRAFTAASSMPALEPGSDLCLLLGHSLKAALVARQGAQLAGARLPPLTCHSRVLQLAAGLLCTLGSRAYSLVTLNLPLGLPSAGELAGCHLSDDLLTVLRHRDQELESAKRSGFRVVDAGTAASQTVGSHNSTTVSNRRMSVKRVQVTILDLDSVVQLRTSEGKY